MKKAPLQFSIPKPCKESFANMPQAGEGRLCGKCETIIYDFSPMTDAELIRFFEAKPETHCGRFHNFQLNRPIEPVVIRNKFISRFSKIAASVIAILTLRSAPAKAQGEMRPVLTQNPQVNKQPVPADNPIHISGTVKDYEGKPIKGASVKFDNIQSTETDGNGAYSFELSGINEPHNIYFDMDDYVRTVRNYHPAMGDATFDVDLVKRDTTKFHSAFLGGVIVYSGLEDLPSLTFKNQSYRLTADMKTLLAMVAGKMKANPTANIQLNVYSPTCYRKNIWIKRLDAAKAYLVDQQGISEERISTGIEIDGGDMNVLDIRLQ